MSALAEVRSKSFSDEALLDDSQVVIEDTSSLFFTTAMQVDVTGEHLSIGVSVIDKLRVNCSLLLLESVELSL